MSRIYNENSVVQNKQHTKNSQREQSLFNLSIYTFKYIPICTYFLLLFAIPIFGNDFITFTLYYSIKLRTTEPTAFLQLIFLYV